MENNFTAGRPKKPSHRTRYRRKMRIARTLWLSKDLDREVTMYALELIGVADADGRILSTDFRAWLEAQGQPQESA